MVIPGLIDLVEFFPASIAAIIRYFKAETTRGTWKNVAMDGTDWPSPAEALHSLESEVKYLNMSGSIVRTGTHIRHRICFSTS